MRGKAAIVCRGSEVCKAFTAWALQDLSVANHMG